MMTLIMIWILILMVRMMKLQTNGNLMMNYKTIKIIKALKLIFKIMNKKKKNKKIIINNKK